MLSTDKETYEKMVGIWTITKIPGLSMKIVGDKLNFIWLQGPLVSLDMALFDQLAPIEIVEILEKKMDEDYGIKGKKFRSDFSAYLVNPFSSQR